MGLEFGDGGAVSIETMERQKSNKQSTFLTSILIPTIANPKAPQDQIPLEDEILLLQASSVYTAALINALTVSLS